MKPLSVWNDVDTRAKSAPALAMVMFAVAGAILTPGDLVVGQLAMAGSLAAKKRIPVSAGTLPTHGPLFVALLIGVVLLVGLLNYVPALALGPVFEHLALWPAR